MPTFLGFNNTRVIVRLLTGNRVTMANAKLQQTIQSGDRFVLRRNPIPAEVSVSLNVVTAGFTKRERLFTFVINEMGRG